MASDGRPSRTLPTPFVLRRAVTQVALLVAVLAVVVAGSTLVGTCTLLLTTAQQETLTAVVRGTADEDLAATASLTVTEPTSGDAADVAAVLDDTSAVVSAALEPFPSTTSTWLTSAMQHLPAQEGASPRLAYLLDAEGLPDHAALDSGRWPAPGASGSPHEVAVPTATADRLGLDLRSEVRLTAGAERDATAAGVDVVVVGTFTPRHDDADTWSRDRLGGAGFDPEWERLSAYGPFVVAAGTLLDTGAAVDRLSLRTVPDLTSATTASLEQLSAGVRTARAELRGALGDRASAVVVRSALPGTVGATLTQQGLTASGVLVVALVGWVLAGTALALAGRLLTGRRAPEHALLAARGARTRQLVAHAAVESAALAVVAAGAAVPLSVLTYRAVAALPLLGAARLPGEATATPALLLGVGVSAVALAVLLVVPALRTPHAGGERGRLDGVVGRSGADLLLLGVAVLGYLQLRAHRVATGAAPDPVLVAGPVVCLLAGAVLVLRVLPWVARLVEGHARRSRGLVLPLASWEVARRPHTTAGAFLLVLATAAATFGVSFTGTWTGSQQDQADAAVGTDLVVVPAGLPALDHGAALAGVTGGVVAPVTDRPIALGSRLAATDGGTTTRLVAVDTTRAEDLLRGRLPDGATWADLTADLAPTTPLVGPRVPTSDGIRLTVTGDAVMEGASSATPDLLRVTPNVVVEDDLGTRLVLPGPAVPLDGEPHDVVVETATDGAEAPATVTVVALELGLGLSPSADLASDDTRMATATVAFSLGGTAPSPGTAESVWTAATASDAGHALQRTSAEATTQDRPVTVSTVTELVPFVLDRTDASVVVTAFTPDAQLPVVVSHDLAAELDLSHGDRLSLGTGTVDVDALVVGVVPYVPSVPRGPAVLADHDALSRAMLAGGDLSALADRWWVGDVPDPAAAAAATTDLGLGEPTTRQALGEDLRDGPLRVPLRAALWVLVAAALVLALVGTAVHTASGLEARAVEVARLQGLGLSRRDVVTALLVQHTAVTVLVVGLGAGLGALVSWAVGPLLAVSTAGLPPVPEALFVWPWPVQAGVLLALTLGSALVVVPVTAALVRRATVAHLRMDGGS